LPDTLTQEHQLDNPTKLAWSELQSQVSDLIISIAGN
jgi:hypothetical protein